MTVLNTPNDGYFNVLIVLVRAVVACGPMAREDLVELCQAGHDDDPARLRHTLKRWTDLGLFAENEDVVVLAPTEDSVTLPSNLCEATAMLPGLVRRIVFRDENNARFWDSSGALCADLTRGLAWFLAQDIYTADVSDQATIQSLEARQLANADRRIVQNDVRWRGLVAWGSYLGFLGNADAPMIDPTAALRQDLALIFGKNSELTATDFQNRVATVLPVLDKGRYRVQVEEALDPANWQGPSQADLLSTAFSRALWRLDAESVIVLESRADTGDSRVLQRAGGQNWRRFTHVRLEERAA